MHSGGRKFPPRGGGGGEYGKRGIFLHNCKNLFMVAPSKSNFLPHEIIIVTGEHFLANFLSKEEISFQNSALSIYTVVENHAVSGEIFGSR